MPWIPMYLYDDDVEILVDWLNNEADIAFIVPMGKPGWDKKWHAVRQVESLQDGQHMLWHIPSGPLPMGDRLIEDLWSGWSEGRPGTDPEVPHIFSFPGVFDLSLHK